MTAELGISHHPADPDTFKEKPVDRHRSIGERFSRAVLTGGLIWGGTAGMIGVSSPPSYDFSEFDSNASHITLTADNNTICDVPDPDKGQPGSFVGMSRYFLKGRGTIKWVKADIELKRLQGTSSSPDDPKDGSVWVMEKGYGPGNFVQLGIINRGHGNRIFSAWAHNLGSENGTYCERYFGRGIGSYTFSINHDRDRGIFYLKKTVWLYKEYLKLR